MLPSCSRRDHRVGDAQRTKEDAVTEQAPEGTPREEHETGQIANEPGPAGTGEGTSAGADDAAPELGND
jgi:hypothetical protein